MAINSSDLPPHVQEAIRRQRAAQPVRARGMQHKPGKMNKTEAAYAGEVLALAKATGRVAWYAFEAVKLRLADKTYYTPDFLVMLADGTLEAHEVKGFWRDDARVKIKVAAELFPFRFMAISKQTKKDGGGWAAPEWISPAKPAGNPPAAPSTSE